MTQPQIVVIGGGTGTFVVLSGLKQFPVKLNAIVSVADSGGSTGRLRDEFGFLPVGDLRQALAALAHNQDHNLIQDLLLYRFSKGSGLEGHNLGNLILTALQDMTGSTAKAVALASKIFRLHGHIYPITTQTVDLVVEYTDGTFVIGEHHLNPGGHGGKTIKKIRLSPNARIFTEAKECLLNSQLIVMGPGDLYASILPNLIVGGVKTTLQNSHAKIVYVCNLMTSFAQTHQLSAQGHLAAIEKHLPRPVDYIVVNSTPIPRPILQAYARQHEYPVVDDLPSSSRILRRPLIKKTSTAKADPADPVIRSYLRHDPHRLAAVLYQLL